MRTREEVLNRLAGRVEGKKTSIEATPEVLHDILVTILDIREMLKFIIKPPEDL